MKTSGEFLQPLPIEGFIGGSSHISFSTKRAQISGKYFTGLELENCTFELEIFDDGTCDFKCLNKGVRLSKTRRKELLDTLKYQDQTFVNLRNKKLITELPFSTKVDGSEVKVYLSLPSQKPIDKLSQILSQEVSVDKKVLDRISDLFGDEDEVEIEAHEDKEDQIVENHEPTLDIQPVFGQTLALKFDEMRAQKLEELKSELSSINEERLKMDAMISSHKISLNRLDKQRETLKIRIQDMDTKEGSLDYYFWVSPLTDKELSLEGVDSDIYEKAVDEVLLKLSKWLPITSDFDKLKDLLKTGYYIVKFGKEDATGTVVEIPYKELSQDILDNIPNATHRHENILLLGNEPWGVICRKFTKLGYKQSATFNQQLDQNHKNDTQN